jgi:hypothetical protein
VRERRVTYLGGGFRPEKQKERDVVGFLLIATFLGGLEVGLPRDAVAKVLGIDKSKVRVKLFRFPPGQHRGCFMPTTHVPKRGVGKKRGLCRRWVLRCSALPLPLIPHYNWHEGNALPPIRAAGLPFTSISKPSRGPLGRMVTLRTKARKLVMSDPRSSSAAA